MREGSGAALLLPFRAPSAPQGVRVPPSVAHGGKKAGGGGIREGSGAARGDSLHACMFKGSVGREKNPCCPLSPPRLGMVAEKNVCE